MYSAQTDNKPVNRSQGSLVSLVCLVFLSPPATLLSKISIDLQNFVKFRKPCQICQCCNWSRSCFVSEANASKQENQGRAPLSTATLLHFAASSSPPSPQPSPPTTPTAPSPSKTPTHEGRKSTRRWRQTRSWSLTVNVIDGRDLGQMPRLDVWRGRIGQLQYRGQLWLIRVLAVLAGEYPVIFCSHRRHNIHHAHQICFCFFPTL